MIHFRKIGSIGFCMGGEFFFLKDSRDFFFFKLIKLNNFVILGAVSLALASHLAEKKPLSAVVSCYGIPSSKLCDLSVIGVKTPVQVPRIQKK